MSWYLWLSAWELQNPRWEVTTEGREARAQLRTDSPEHTGVHAADHAEVPTQKAVRRAESHALGRQQEHYDTGPGPGRWAPPKSLDHKAPPHISTFRKRS